MRGATPPEHEGALSAAAMNADISTHHAPPEILQLVKQRQPPRSP